MNRVLLNSTMMTPAERAAGRFMRAPDHPAGGGEGGADSSAAGNNGGNVSGVTNGGEPEDNSGAADELDGFWDGKPEAEGATGEDDETKQASQALGQELGGLIKSFKPSEVFTKETADKIADGDLSGINSALNEHAQAIMQHQMVVTAKLLGGVIDRLSADFDARIQNALGQKDSEIALETHFPLAKDPTMRPMVQRVWDQALVNSKGDRQKAIRLTKGMLDAFGEKTGGGLREAAQDPTAGINTAASKSLVNELLGRD